VGHPTIEEIIEIYKKDWGNNWQEMLFHELFAIHASQVLGSYSLKQDHWYLLIRAWCLEKIIQSTGDYNDSSKT
jgi:hypothetical protein